MLINAAPRSYTSNIVADADLNLEGYNVTANALYSKDNYLLTMLDYGEAFPTDVKEGDKLFAWGEDSTKSYIYTYKHGAWDAGVKPQHMADYYIADEKRVVNFCLISPHPFELGKGYELYYHDMGPSSLEKLSVSERSVGVLFGPNTYFIGSIGAGIGVVHWGAISESFSFTLPAGVFYFYFTNCTSVAVEVGYCLNRDIDVSFPVSDASEQHIYYGDSLPFPAKVNSFNIRYDNFGTIENLSSYVLFNVSLFYYIG